MYFTGESGEDLLQYDKSTIDELHKVIGTICPDTCHSVCFIPKSNHGMFAYILSEHDNCEETLAPPKLWCGIYLE